MRKFIMIILLVLTSLFLNRYVFLYEIEVIKENKELTIENVLEELYINEVLFPEIVIKQVKLETGHLKHIYKNNLFGFHNGKRFLEFESWQEAVKFKKTWQDKKYKGGNYYEFLMNLPYAQDPEYIAKLKKIK